MVIHYSKPVRRYVVTHAATDYYVEDYTKSCDVHLRENAVDTAHLLIADEYADYYGNCLTSRDRLRIYFGYLDAGDADPPTNLIFDGYIDDVSPSIMPNRGIFSAVTARSVGRSILFTTCGEEYGAESPNDTMDTLKEIIADATYGIVPQWVNKLFGTAVDTGYSLGLSDAGTDTVANIVGAITYMYFAYQPVKKCLDDVMDYVQAIKGAAAGPHYIVTPDNYLCVATVGNHEAGPATKWPTWWNTDQAGSTLVQGTDFMETNFNSRPVDANYILYHGRLDKPTKEVWTEEGVGSSNGADLWALEDAVSWAKEDDTDADDYKQGSSSVHFTITDDAVAKYAQVPSGGAQNWEIDHWGGEYNKPYLHWYCKIANQVTTLSVELHTGAGGADYWAYNFFSKMTPGTWREFNVPVGPYWNEDAGEDFSGWVKNGNADWGDIDAVRFISACQALNTGDVWIDGLYFHGWLLRGARPAAAYSATNPVQVRVITDDVAKDDSGVTATVTGSMARLSYAELLRAKTTPIQGTITIPGQYQIQAGQLCHIHAAKTRGTTYRINDDFRIQEHHLSFRDNGLQSTLVLTDDVTNGRPLPPKDAYNLLLKATNPDYQNRQLASIKARDIDITQPIMEHSY